MRKIFKSQEGPDPLPSPIIMWIQYWIEIFNTIYVTTIGHMISVGPSLRLTKPVPIVNPEKIQPKLYILQQWCSHSKSLKEKLQTQREKERKFEREKKKKILEE